MRIGVAGHMLVAALPFLSGVVLAQSHFDAIPRGDRNAATGPAVGGIIPDFALPDQSGQVRTFASLAGPRGALILFYRSADW